MPIRDGCRSSRTVAYRHADYRDLVDEEGVFSCPSGSRSLRMGVDGDRVFDVSTLHPVGRFGARS